MSFLTDINCTTVLEAIKKERSERKNELENQNECDNDFVNISPQQTMFWTDMFANCFLCYEQNSSVTNSLAHDDMLFFVSKANPEQSKIEVYRRDSKKLPFLTDFNYDWEETVYLNLILHEFEYTLTCAICTQSGAKDLEILKRHSKRVFASPSKRDLQSKGTEEEITYPNIYFTIDDFDSAFNEMIVKENEMVCVELIANDGKFRKVLFLGSIKYESLKKVYDARASTSSRMLQKVFSQKRVEFVRMKGPGAKGYAEMAVSRYEKDPLSTVTTPTGSYSVASSPMSEDSFSGFWKSNSNSNNGGRKKSVSSVAYSSAAGTPEIEARDIRQDMIDSNKNSNFWSRTFGLSHSFAISSFFNQKQTSYQEPIEMNDNQTNFNPKSVPLNAYLTYVTLKLPMIMNDVLETRQKSLLTF